MSSEEIKKDSNGMLLTVGEAAEKLRVSTRTVWRMIEDGQLKAVHIRGCTRVSLHTVEEYLKLNERVGCV